MTDECTKLGLLRRMQDEFSECLVALMPDIDPARDSADVWLVIDVMQFGEGEDDGAFELSCGATPDEAILAAARKLGIEEAE